jgi:surface antigen
LKTTKKPVAIILAASLLTGACASGQEGAGQAIGAILATGVCLALVHKNNAACIAAAAAGFVVGGAIGHKLDVRDRKRREEALARTLNDERLWNARRGAAPMSNADVAARPVSYVRPTTDSNTAAATEWHNPDTDNSGRIEPLRTYVGGPQHNQTCRQFRETYFKNGEPVVAVEQECLNAQGQWQ